MPFPRLVLRVVPWVLVGSLLVLPVGSHAAAATGHQARTASKIRYRLTVDFRAKDTYTQTAAGGALEGESNQIATFRAKSKSAFYIRRSYSGRSRPTPRFSFVTAMAGEFAWEGGGFGGLGSPGCVYKWTEEVWPDKTLVSGFVRMISGGTPRMRILISPDAYGEIGTLKYHPDASCTDTARPFTSTSLILLNLPEQLTEPVDLRRKFGRTFTIRYAPGALRDRPNTVAGNVKGVFDFAWTLRFTPARR